MKEKDKEMPIHKSKSPTGAGHFEIERKFLIRYPDIPWLESLAGCQRINIVQTYLASEDGEVRVRRWETDGGVLYYETAKRKISEIKRAEVEREITEDEYCALLTHADPQKHPVEKTRYRLPYAGRFLEIDVYPFWQDRAILEAELEDDNEDIRLPEVIHVIREVTADPCYKNASLAQHVPENF